ncbi:MAG: hypothetical protein ACRDNS_13985 [Trebonia sp.]
MATERLTRAPPKGETVITGITEIAHITTKQDMSRWTRAHADRPGINWSVFAGPGGTMIIVEHAEDRCSQHRAMSTPEVAAPVHGSVEGAADGRLHERVKSA